MVMTIEPWGLPEIHRVIYRLAAKCSLQYVGQRAQSHMSQAWQVTFALLNLASPLSPGRKLDSMTFKGTLTYNVKLLCWTCRLYNLVAQEGHRRVLSFCCMLSLDSSMAEEGCQQHPGAARNDELSPHSKNIRECGVCPVNPFPDTSA